MLVTKDGFWICGENGLHRYDYNKKLFNNTFFDKAIEPFSSQPQIENITIPRTANETDSTLLFNVTNKGSFVYNIPLNQIKKSSDLLSGSIITRFELYNAFLDNENILWSGTYPYGLVVYDITNNKLIVNPNTCFNTDGDWANEFLQDSKKRLWIGSYGKLYLASDTKTSFMPVDEVNSVLEKEQDATIFNGIDEDKEGNIWFLTGGRLPNKKNTLGVYNPATKKVITYNYLKNKNDGFPEGDILNYLACDKKGNGFVSTQNGLLHFFTNKTAPAFEMLTTANGLINNNIEQIIKDKEGNIWMSGVFGISCYNPATKTFTNYTNANYSMENFTFPNLSISPNTGKIYIAQNGGYSYFDPKNISSTNSPLLRFTELNIFNKPFLQYGNKLQDSSTIYLKYDQNMITIEFATTSFTNAADNQYAFMLQGLDKDWNYSKNNFATYTNLSSGKYTFLVKAKNYSGVWSAKSIALFIHVNPPFWKTWWFLLIGLIALSGSIYYFFQMRINRIKERFTIRNKIAGDLHDEIGSTLTSINILSNVSQQAIDADPEQTKTMLDQIAQQSKIAQQNMSDIVWAIKPDNEKIENLVVRLREYAAYSLEPKGIKTEINGDEALLNKVLPIDYRKEVLLICKEALNNIAKHSGASLANLSLKQNNKQFILEIKDNGVWKGNEVNSGTGLKSMKQRATSIGGQFNITHSENGTWLELLIPIT